MFKCTKFQVRNVKKFWRWVVVMIVPPFKCTKSYRTIQLKMVNMVNFFTHIINNTEKKQEGRKKRRNEKKIRKKERRKESKF